jgi:hypothetical protein
VTRALALIGVLGTLILAAGCGGEESALCGSLEDVQGSLQSIRDTELEQGALEELQQEADELNGSVTAAREAAGDELGNEFAAVETSLQALRTQVEAAGEGEVSRETVTALAGPISETVAAFDALFAAAPDCNL